MLSKFKFTLKNSVIYSFGNMAGKLSGFILLPLYAEFLPIEEFGVLGLVEIINLLLLVLTSLGLKSAFTRWYWDENFKNQQKSLFFTTYFVNSAATVFTSIIAFVLISFFSEIIFSIKLPQHIIILFSLANFFKLLIDFPMLLLQIQHKSKKYVAMQLIILFFTVGITYYLLKYESYKLESIFVAQFAGNFVVFLLLLPLILKNISFRFEKTELFEMWKFGFPLMISNIVTLTLVLTDRFIINIFEGLSDTGNYVMASKIANIIKLLFVTSFMHSFVHVFYKTMHDKDFNRFNSKILTYYILFIVFGGLGLIMYSKEIIQLISMNNTEYWRAIPIIPVLVWSIIFVGIKSQIILPLQKLKKTKIISIISISAAILNFVLNMILIPQLSSIGAAIATLTTNIIASAILYYYVKKYNKINYEIVKIFKIILVGIVILAIYYYINDFEIVLRLILKTLLLIMYFVALLLWNFLEKIEIIRLKQLINKWKNPKNWKRNIKKDSK